MFFFLIFVISSIILGDCIRVEKWDGGKFFYFFRFVFGDGLRGFGFIFYEGFRSKKLVGE